MDTELIWASGLFEGEGCIHLQKGRYIHLNLVSKDRDVVERFVVAIGEGEARPKQVTPKRGEPYTAWQWNLTGGRAERVLLLLLPHLGKRRSEVASAALAARAEMYCPHTQADHRQFLLRAAGRP